MPSRQSRLWGSRARLSRCGTLVALFCSMWNLPGTGAEPMAPELEGRCLTTGSPGKSFAFCFCLSCSVSCKWVCFVFFSQHYWSFLLLPLHSYKPPVYSGYQEFTRFSSNTCMVSYAYIFISALFRVFMIAVRNVYNFYLFQIAMQLY